MSVVTQDKLSVIFEIMTRLTMKLSVGLGTLKLFFIMSSTSLNYYTTAEFICPDVSYIEESALMNCSTSTPYTALQYTGPRSTLGPQCIASLQLCTPINEYNASIINQTHSSLRILTVKPHHAGQWTCADIPNGPLASCNVVITKTPTCSITSTEDTDVFALYQTLTLTVDIRGYFCSAAFHFSLQTGNVSTLLLGAEHVANVTDKFTAVTLNVTKSHLGIVGLIFSCHTKQWNTTCDGVTELKTPTCSISSDKDTDKLALYEDLILLVDIIGYNCLVASNFTLQTGNVQQLLYVSHAKAGFDRAAQTFNVTEAHLGDVRLISNCQHKHWNLTCDGITKLLERVVMVIVIITVISVIVVFVFNNKQVTGSEDTHTCDNVDETVNGERRVSAVYPFSGETVHQTEDNVVVGSGGSASRNAQQRPGLRINPVYIPTTLGGSLELHGTTVTTGTSTEAVVMGGHYLHPEPRGEYLALDRNAVQPSNIYEHLRIYEQTANM
ncbi:uncharacterized protein LOC125375939 isoform X3 [Haliotis rufescens]|uniref:uncharacterized protein LOC125375939 isoform X3 n=1 Tax=Haliotis rufescens TaxID=6454 RepID=UPI00201E994D|nr:uncharacterized protein LOC125375939 isoform X3 [Haliotis rufescens]